MCRFNGCFQSGLFCFSFYVFNFLSLGFDFVSHPDSAGVDGSNKSNEINRIKDADDLILLQTRGWGFQKQIAQ